MYNYSNIIKNSSLFNGIEHNDIDKILKCLSATEKKYSKNEFIFTAGNSVTSAGFVVSGCVHIIKEDFWGNRAILTRCDTGSLFGEVYAILTNEPLCVSAIANEDTAILFLDVSKVLRTCGNSCLFHNRLIHNVVSDLAKKNLTLTQKIEHMSHRTTREKLLSYLSEQSLKHGSSEFIIPFNRQQLADYLSVDRSAMSKELCSMRDDGILEFEKNKFKLNSNNM